MIQRIENVMAAFRHASTEREKEGAMVLFACRISLSVSGVHTAHDEGGKEMCVCRFG